MQRVNASEFKEKCLDYMVEVNQTGAAILNHYRVVGCRSPRGGDHQFLGNRHVGRKATLDHTGRA